MASEGTSNWADWKVIRPNECFWAFGQAFASADFAVPLLGANLAKDVLDGLASLNTQFGTIPKPAAYVGNITPTQGAPNYFGWAAQIALPDFLLAKQPGNLADWSGEEGDDSLDDEDGSNLVALQIENVIALADVPGLNPDLVIDAALLASVKYRGYGAPDLDGVDTQDTPIAGTEFVAGSVFPDMTGDASFFDGSGNTVRMQSLVLVPNTSGSGDYVEVISLFDPGAFLRGFNYGQYTGAVLQWYGVRYRWVTQPFSFDTQTTVQLTNDENGEDESQPRVDEFPYEP